MTAINVIIVVFLTSVIVGQETRFISALTSCRNCTMRPGPDCPRSRRTDLLSVPSPKRELRGVPIGASGLSVSAIFELLLSRSHHFGRGTRIRTRTFGFGDRRANR